MRRLLHITLLLLLPALAVAQDDSVQQQLWQSYQRYVDSVNDEYLRYTGQQRQSYQRYTDSVSDEFLRYVEQRWQDYRLYTGEHRPTRHEPLRQPVADPSATSPDTLSAIIVDTAVIHQPDAKPVTNSLSQNPDSRSLSVYVPFYGLSLDFSVPATLCATTLGGHRESHVADYWRSLNRIGLESCCEQLSRQQRRLQLNDYALFRLSMSLAATLYPSLPDEQCALVVYLLNSLHYNSKVGSSDDGLVILLATANRIYDMPFVEDSRNRYYVFAPASRSKVSGNIKTYNRQLSQSANNLSLYLSQSPLLGVDASPKPYTYRFDSGNTLSFAVNRQLIDFYSDYPSVELAVYARAAASTDFNQSVVQGFAPLLADKVNRQEAVGQLLQYVQRGFDYQPDIRQFGTEKTFFCEENFYYPANDCEDRAILFARMVRLLTSLDVVLLEFHDHVAAAVCFADENVQGTSVRYAGRRYTVCDPTYIDAAVGMLPQRYHNEKPKLIQVL